MLADRLSGVAPPPGRAVVRSLPVRKARLSSSARFVSIATGGRIQLSASRRSAGTLQEPNASPAGCGPHPEAACSAPCGSRSGTRTDESSAPGCSAESFLDPFAPGELLRSEQLFVLSLSL